MVAVSTMLLFGVNAYTGYEHKYGTKFTILVFVLGVGFDPNFLEINCGFISLLLNVLQSHLDVFS